MLLTTTGMVVPRPSGVERSTSKRDGTDDRLGTGAVAEPGKKVTVHYTGWTTDGKMFDTSLERGQPISFPLTGVIEGWTEGVQLMTIGEKMRFWIPERLAYKGKDPKGMLVFDVELLAIR